MWSPLSGEQDAGDDGDISARKVPLQVAGA
jgi:hypothetical protein